MQKEVVAIMKPNNPLVIVKATRRARREVEEAYAAGRFQDGWTRDRTDGPPQMFEAATQIAATIDRYGMLADPTGNGRPIARIKVEPIP